MDCVLRPLKEGPVYQKFAYKSVKRRYPGYGKGAYEKSQGCYGQHFDQSAHIDLFRAYLFWK